MLTRYKKKTFFLTCTLLAGIYLFFFYDYSEYNIVNRSCYLVDTNSSVYIECRRRNYLIPIKDRFCMYDCSVILIKCVFLMIDFFLEKNLL